MRWRPAPPRCRRADRGGGVWTTMFAVLLMAVLGVLLRLVAELLF